MTTATGPRDSVAGGSSGDIADDPPVSVQETNFATPRQAQALAQQSELVATPKPKGRHAKKLSYGSISNGYPSSPPSFSPPSSGHGAADQSVTSTATATTVSARVLAPDLLRGLLMVLQSIDHSAMHLGVWRHGVAKENESDGAVMHEWNPGRAWFTRMATHLCAPGFMFLLGMGTVYFTQSRSKLGWSAPQLLRHYFVRMAVLVLVNQALGLLLMLDFAEKVWMLNIVLVALAVNYFLSGLLCLLFRYTEPKLSRVLSLRIRGPATYSEVTSSGDDDDSGSANAPLLPAAEPTLWATRLSWHVHNLVLAILTGVSILGNIWLSPDGGRCSTESLASTSFEDTKSLLAHGGGVRVLEAPSNRHSTFFDFWFYPMMSGGVISAFPPLAWSSFAVFGVLYARIVTGKRWKPQTIVRGNLAVAVLLGALFVLTRLLHFGNLSEDCLHMPEQLAHPGKNQYLASWRSFFYVVKYPPSLSFFSLTLSLDFLLLALFGAMPVRVAVKIPGLMNFGSSALFFYVVHFVVYKTLAVPVVWLFGHTLPDKDQQTGLPMFGLGDTAAYWVTWLVGLAILSPLCRVYGRFKARQPADSVWRFF